MEAFDCCFKIPNSAGVVLAMMQLSLFLIFPRKLGAGTPLGFCFSTDSKIGKDVEKVVELSKRKGEKSQKPTLPDARQGLKPSTWQKPVLPDRSVSSIR